MFVVAPFQVKYSILFYVSDGTAFSYRLTDLLPILPRLFPPSFAAAGVPQGMDGRQAAAQGASARWPRGQAGLQEHCGGVTGFGSWMVSGRAGSAPATVFQGADE